MPGRQVFHGTLLFCVLLSQLFGMTSGNSLPFGELGRMLRGGRDDDFAPCADNSKPMCPDGSEPDKTSKPPSCSSGSPVCADGSQPQPSPEKPENEGCRGKGGRGSKGGRRLQDSEDQDVRGRDGKDHHDANYHGKDDDDCVGSSGAGDDMSIALLASAVGGSVCGLCICVGLGLMCKRRCVHKAAEPPSLQSSSLGGHVQVAEPDAAFVVGHPVAGGMANPKVADGEIYKQGPEAP